MSDKVTPTKLKSGPTTRLKGMVYGLGAAISEEDSCISGARLPTCGQVLRCMMWHMQEGLKLKQSKWESAKLVLPKVLVFFAKANLPVISEIKACEKIINLVDDNAKLRAISTAHRSLPASLEKIASMERNLATTFSLWPADV